MNDQVREKVDRLEAAMLDQNEAALVSSGLLACPFCSMPNVIDTVFDKESVTYAAQCPDCYACGPIEETHREAIEAWKRRAHDAEWTYRKGRKIADRFADAIGQYDERKREALAVELAEELAR